MGLICQTSTSLLWHRTKLKNQNRRSKAWKTDLRNNPSLSHCYIKVTFQTIWELIEGLSILANSPGLSMSFRDIDFEPKNLCRKTFDIFWFGAINRAAFPPFLCSRYKPRSQTAEGRERARDRGWVVSKYRVSDRDDFCCGASLASEYWET